SLIDSNRSLPVHPLDRPRPRLPRLLARRLRLRLRLRRFPSVEQRRRIPASLPDYIIIIPCCGFD
uniref:Uncharacterized protein n=1 Tax=Oryza meridionalis TaxID=40149 RepID=A0A0E0EJU3_9ORYZ